MVTEAQREKANEVRAFFDDKNDTQIIADLAAQNEQYQLELEKLDERVDRQHDLIVKQYDEIRRLEDVNAKYAERHLKPPAWIGDPLCPISDPEQDSICIKLPKGARLAYVGLDFPDNED